MQQDVQKGSLVIHIGPRKTATTYLQSNFYLNSEVLEERGWLYPVIAVRTQNAHHEVASAREQFIAGSGPIVARLKNAAKRAEKANLGLLLSSEGFFAWKPADYLALAECLGYKRLTIVYVLRDPVSVFASRWVEMVKNGKTQSLPALIEQHFSNPQKSRLLNPLLVLRPFIDAERIDLKVLNFEAIKTSQEDFFTAFCRLVLEISDMTPARTSPANTSYPVEFTEYLRMLSPLFGFERKPQELMFARAVERCHSDRERQAIVAAIVAYRQEAGISVVQPRNTPWFAQMDRRLRQLLGERLLPGVESERLFTDTDLTLTCYDTDILAEKADIKALLQKSVKKMRPGRAFWLWTTARMRILLLFRSAKRKFGL